MNLKFGIRCLPVLGVIVLMEMSCSSGEVALSRQDRYMRLFSKMEGAEWRRSYLAWWTDYLTKVGEQPIYTLTTTEETHYRVLYHETGRGMRCIHLMITPQRKQISSYTWQSTQEGVILLGRSVSPLEDSDVSTIRAILDSSGIWQTPRFPQELVYLDGGRWLIEVMQGGKYHMTYIEYAEGGILEFCSAVCRLAKNKAAERTIDWRGQLRFLDN